jgi:3-hydroxy-3-methylglutaryl CoA synthase
MTKEMRTSVGIDDINLYASTLSLDFARLAAARAVSDKDLRKVGFDARSVLPPYEDPVSLAVNAAKPIVDVAGPESFGLLIVATETGIDFGKPLSTYVHKFLGLPSYCANYEIKHACYAGTAALQAAVAWARTRASEQRGERALVVTTDIARRQLGKLVEMTAGAGAVAMSIANTPRVLEIELPRGCAAQEAFDVARPTATTEWDDPLLSLSAYLDLAEGAWDEYRLVTGATSLEERFDYMLYHTPLVSLAKRGHQLLLESERDDVTEDESAASFEQMVTPSLRFNRRLGNIYSGSLYASLTGLVDNGAAIAPGTRVGMFSYGSGACGEIFSGLVGQEARSVVAAHRIGDHLAARREVTVSDYDAAAREVELSLSTAEYEPSTDFIEGHWDAAYKGKGRLVLERVENYYRRYGWS